MYKTMAVGMALTTVITGAYNAAPAEAATLQEGIQQSLNIQGIGTISIAGAFPAQEQVGTPVPTDAVIILPAETIPTAPTTIAEAMVSTTTTIVPPVEIPSSTVAPVEASPPASSVPPVTVAASPSGPVYRNKMPEDMPTTTTTTNAPKTTLNAPVTTKAVQNTKPVASKKKYPMADIDPATINKFAKCESGDKANTNTGNGYYGRFQFGIIGWGLIGGKEFAPYPHQATAAEQAIAFRRLVYKQGFIAFPGCASQLNLVDKGVAKKVIAEANAARRRKK